MNGRRVMPRLLVLYAVILAGALGMVASAAPSGPIDAGNVAPIILPAMPACEEDAVLVGVGDFTAGRWTAYQCGPAVDDYWGW